MNSGILLGGVATSAMLTASHGFISRDIATTAGIGLGSLAGYKLVGMLADKLVRDAVAEGKTKTKAEAEKEAVFVVFGATALGACLLPLVFDALSECQYRAMVLAVGARFTGTDVVSMARYTAMLMGVLASHTIATGGK